MMELSTRYDYNLAELTDLKFYPLPKRGRKRWFAWYPVHCYDRSGMYYLGLVWLNYVYYEVWNDKFYYFHGEDDDEYS